MSRVWGSLSELMISVIFSVTRKRRFSSSRLVTLAKTVWPSWKTSAVSLKNRSAIAWRGGGSSDREDSGLKLPGSDLMIWFCVCLDFFFLLTHRLGREADEAVRELHEDAIGHDVFNPANQLHSNADFGEIFGEHSFLQRPPHGRLLGEGLDEGAVKENNQPAVKKSD